MIHNETLLFNYDTVQVQPNLNIYSIFQITFAW